MISQNPLISIIIPSFQQGDYLRQALYSISQQSFLTYEVVIIDACSTDNTCLVVSEFDDMPIVFEQGPDGGVYDAMNKGVKLAKGDWLYFMGCDDKLYDKNVLNTVSNYFDNYGLDMIYGDVILNSSGKRYSGEFNINRLLCLDNICHQAIFYKKSIFNKIGYYNLNYKIWADWDFNLRCFKHTELNIKYVNMIVAFYNDEFGVSNTYDKVFSNELPLFYIAKANEFEAKYISVLNSNSFIIGNKLINFLNKIKKIIAIK